MNLCVRMPPHPIVLTNVVTAYQDSLCTLQLNWFDNYTGLQCRLTVAISEADDA